MIKFRYLLSVLSLGLVLLLSGCKVAVLQPRGFIAKDEKELLIVAVLLMLTVVVPVIIFTIVICIRYRASNTKAKYTPNWSHSTMLEGIWWTIPLVIIIVLGTLTWIYTHRLDPYKPINEKALGLKTKPITIQVVALQWKWLFIYPQQKIATVNFVEFPLHTPVSFQITSDAPMNSFQIPQLGGQIYAMNGMRTRLHLIASEVGDYNGGSTNFSGDGFAGMRFVARVTTEQGFEQWVRSVQKSPNKLTLPTYNQLAMPSENNNPTYYALVDNQLFMQIMMKFMTPDRHNVDINELGVHL